MTARERVARAWHAGSDHAADGTPFGGPLCNCDRIAGRIIPMLAGAWSEGLTIGICVKSYVPSPYETEEGQ